MVVSLKWRYLQIIHLNGIFIINKPFWDLPIYGNHPNSKFDQLILIFFGEHELMNPPGTLFYGLQQSQESVPMNETREISQCPNVWLGVHVTWFQWCETSHLQLSHHWVMVVKCCELFQIIVGIVYYVYYCVSISKINQTIFWYTT